MSQLRKHLTYANVMVTLLAVVVLGGATAYAASQLAKNSVGTKQLRKNAVTGAKVKNKTLTGKDVNLKKLGTVPKATHASTADTAGALTPPEATHVVGAAGEPGFLSGSSNAVAVPGLTLKSAGFYKDHEGIVHLEGSVVVGKGGGLLTPIFTLPPGYRPAPGGLQIFTNVEETAIFVAGAGATFEGRDLSGVVAGKEEGLAVLSGITFRPEG